MKCLLVFLLGISTLSAQTSSESGEQLKFVVIMSRHGVRSPTGKAEQLNPYSAQPWPKWSVPPGHLTGHGAKLLTLMGAYDRELLAQQGLLAANGCGDAVHVSIVADSDQRTRETGRALATGMFPGCSVPTQALPEGTNDPLFHPLKEGMGHTDRDLATAAVSGRIGANPNALIELYRPQLEMMEEVLRGCKSPCEPEAGGTRVSLFTLPSGLRAGSGDHLVEFKSPLSTGSTFAENLLLEYTEGMDESQVGWGHVDAKKIRRLMELHTAHVELMDRTLFVARAQASNILQHVLATMQQAAGQQPVAGALGQPGDRLLILSGHDTNIASIAGALNLSWLVDGRLNDTPPGGALVFELWKGTAGTYSVRVFYMCQTLEQMRFATPLTLTVPPERVAVFLPGCGAADGSCPWTDFQTTIRASINPAYIP
jgi:4-phytase / acid phosphatase